MKQLIKRTIFWMLVLSAFCVGTALADQFGDAYTDAPPAEVLSHIEKNYSDYLLEDYIAINGTSKGDYGFALLSRKSSRVLVGYHHDGEGMKYWLRNDDAVPRGEGYAFFQRHSAYSYISQGNTSAAYTDALGFDVIRIDKEHEEYWSQSVSYHWRNGAFQLYAYMDRDDGDERAYVTDSGVSYYNFTEDSKLGRVHGTVQRNLKYVYFSDLPKTRAQARESLTVAPEIPSGELSAQSIKFTGGRKYEVYSAPSSTSLRGGNGKAVVSTNDWIQVFGAEDGYILIQYAIDQEQMRFGYIEETALPSNASVQTLRWRDTIVYLSKSTPLTDDPLNSQETLLTLPQGVGVTLLGTMGSWAYVETASADWARGFVPQSVLNYDRVYNLANHSEGKATGAMTIGPDHSITLNMVVSMPVMPTRFLMMDENDVQLGYVSPVAGKPGAYQIQGYLRNDTTCVRFIPVQSDGSQGEELFNVAW